MPKKKKEKNLNLIAEEPTTEVAEIHNPEFVKKELPANNPEKPQKQTSPADLAGDDVDVEARKEKKVSRKNEKEIEMERELNAIYSNGDGTMPDMKQFEQKKRGRFFTAFVILIFSCVILGGVAWAGFFILPGFYVVLKRTLPPYLIL